MELRTSLGPAEPNADGGLCLIANRAAEVVISPREQSVTLTNVEGDSLALNTIGTRNRSTGRFEHAVGGGSLTLTFYRINPGTTTLQLHGTIR